MLQTLKNIWAKVEPYLAKAYSYSAVGVGIAIGYFGHGPIKLACDFVIGLVKVLFKL